jgi:transposase
MAQGRRIQLRPLTAPELAALEQITRAGSERADRVARAKALLAVAAGATLTTAAQLAGRRSATAVEPRHGGGPPRQYEAAERERILREFRRAPDRARDGTATWSLTTLQRALRAAPDGLPHVSTWTILVTLWEAGYTWQQSRTWCPTGTARRKRRDGSVVTTTDPHATPKKR